MGPAVAMHNDVLPGERVYGNHYALNDGLGERWVLVQPPHGQVEVLALAPALAFHAPAEPAIRARAERLADIDAPAVTAVRRVERDAAGMRVVADAVAGIRLSDLLSQLESGGHILSHAGMLALAGAVVRALAVLHGVSSGLAHGAVTPAHIVLRGDGTAVLTDSVFGPALESLEWNREKLWREFHVALPAAASLPRFDQRADVTQLGAVVLAIALRRRLRDDEYPRCAADLVVAATADVSAHGASALRMWLQQALQLHPRSMFPSAVEAQRAFLEIAAAPGVSRAGSRALGETIGRVGATGPHLHYGLQRNGEWVAPVREHRNMPPGEPVPPSAMAAFVAERDRSLAELAHASGLRPQASGLSQESGSH